MKILRGITAALALLATLVLAVAAARADQAIADATLREPWELQKAVVLSLMQAAPQGDAGAQAAAALDKLASGLARFEGQADTVLDRLVGDPQFAYVAAETSLRMSETLADVRDNFESLYTSLGVNQRSDVRAAQAALDSLQATFSRKTPFERDVEVALGSGSRQEILAFANRWWAGEERAIAVRKALAELKQGLAARS
jgi:hypothetical protein